MIFLLQCYFKNNSISKIAHWLSYRTNFISDRLETFKFTRENYFWLLIKMDQIIWMQKSPLWRRRWPIWPHNWLHWRLSCRASSRRSWQTIANRNHRLHWLVPSTRSRLVAEIVKQTKTIFAPLLDSTVGNAFVPIFAQYLERCMATLMQGTARHSALEFALD